MSACLRPFQKNGVPCPCGKCEPCRKRHASGWAFRLMLEAENLGSAFFITLSYDTQHVPKRYEIPMPESRRQNWKRPYYVKKSDSFNRIRARFTFYRKTKRLTVDKCHLQRFIKRLRKRNNAKIIKYYAVSEYGDATMRPHYHAIVMGMDIISFIGLEQWTAHLCGKAPFDGKYHFHVDTWRMGHITIGTVTMASIQYVLKYISKGRRIPQYEGDDRQPESSLMSKGIGLCYITPEMYNVHRKDLERQYVVNWDSKKLAIPRYLKDRLYDSAERQFMSEYYTKIRLAEYIDMGEIERKKYELKNRRSVDDVGMKNQYNVKGIL